MELIKQSYIILLILSIAEEAMTNNIKNRSSYLIPCEDGWYLFGEKCYKVFGKSKGVTWKLAESMCADHQGSLVTIQNRELQDFLMTFLLLNVKSELWIGLHDRYIESNYGWADGSVVNYTYWEPEGPSGRRLNQEDCVEMLYVSKDKIGMWNDIDCDIRMPFICQKHKNEQGMNYDPRFCYGENDVAWKYQSACYHTVRDEMSWDDAENYCQTIFKGHLLAITDANIDLFMKYVLSNFSKEFWIGIKIHEASEQMWSSELKVIFQKWETDHRHKINGTCTFMTETRLWSTAPCFRKLPFVCEVLQEPPLKQAPEGWRCPELSQDWVDLSGDTCYIFETNEQKNWHEANFACLKKGGHLASINSVAEEIAIRRRIMGGPEELLIGLHRSLSDNSVFEWADGTVLDYQHWGYNQPNIGDEGCCEIMTEAMDWHDIPCDYRRGYICSAKKVPPFLSGINESALLPPAVGCLSNCSACTSWNITLTVLFVVIFVLSVVGCTIYVYKNYSRNSTSTYFSMSFPARRKSERNEITADDSVYSI